MEGVGDLAYQPTGTRPRTDSRIVGSLRSRRTESTLQAQRLKILTRRAPVFFLHRQARVCSAVDSWAAW